MTVLIHGAACLDNIMFSYDQLSGRPNQVSLTHPDADAELIVIMFNSAGENDDQRKPRQSWLTSAGWPSPRP